MRAGFLGTGSWGFCLARLIASNGHEVISWTNDPELELRLKATKVHPRFPEHRALDKMEFTSSLEECLKGVDLLVESVTAAGIRPVFEKVRELGVPDVPIILTSKGIEQESGLILSDVLLELFGEGVKKQIGSVSGPSYAQEVIRGQPTSVVGTAYEQDVIEVICAAFSSPAFRIYPNRDIQGVSYGGALKNVIAIACGISDGLGYGFSARAALMTRGLHEMRKLAMAKGSEPQTLNGLSGMGDLCVTCSSPLSRNYRYGELLAEGNTPEEAKEKIGMVIEGEYTCVTALQLSREEEVSMPITEMVYQIVFDRLEPKDAVKLLMQRSIKEEHL